MTNISLSAATQQLINAALNSGPGVNNANYVAAYNAIYNDIKNTAMNPGTLSWFSMAGSVNGEQWQPSAAGTFIWAFTQSAAQSEGYTIPLATLQSASDRIALSVFQKLEQNGFVLTDDPTNTTTGFAPTPIVAGDAQVGISYLQSLYPNLDFATWGGTLFARTSLNDPSYLTDYGLNLTPLSKDCNAILAGTSAALQAIVLSGSPGIWY